MDWGIVWRDVALLVLEYAKVLAWPFVVLIAFAVFGKTLKRTIGRINKAKVGDIEVSLSQLATKLTHKAQGIEPELKVGFFRRFWGHLSEFFIGPLDPSPSPDAQEAAQSPAAVGPSLRPGKGEDSETEGSASGKSQPPKSHAKVHPTKTKDMPGYVPIDSEVDFAALGEIVTSWAELESLVFDLHQRVLAGGGGSQNPYRRRGSVSQAVDDLHRARMVSREDLDTFREAQTFRNMIVHAPGDRRFGTYAEFLTTIATLKEAVLSWYAKFR